MLGPTKIRRVATSPREAATGVTILSGFSFVFLETMTTKTMRFPKMKEVKLAVSTEEKSRAARSLNVF